MFDLHFLTDGMNRVLLSFIGNNDCRPEEKGPVLTLLHARSFEKVYLLYNHERYLQPGRDLSRYCREHFPGTMIHLIPALSENPADYLTVYPAMYQALRRITASEAEGVFTISLTSGTPVMHACWIFLREGGVIDAALVQISRESGVTEVTFSLDDFPEIRKVDAIKAEMTRLSRENAALRGRLGLSHDAIIGQSPPVLRMKEQIRMLAGAAIPVLIRGETGSGKELVAEALHHNSLRKEKPLIRVNCGAIPSELFESAFFGHKKGAFTGAVSDHAGFIRQADGGTLFLDEIADLPLLMQVKLLRFLDGGGFVPPGRSLEERADVRIIAASHRDLREQVRERRFREDLFYRLAAVEIIIPPLRERGEDKILIAQHILNEINSRHKKRKKLDASALKRILSYRWPGNVRQLKGALEAACLMAGDEITADHIPIIEVETPTSAVVLPEEGVDLNGVILPAYYRAAMEKTGGNAERAARLLGLKPHTFRARLKALGVKI